MRNPRRPGKQFFTHPGPDRLIFCTAEKRNDDRSEKPFLCTPSGTLLRKECSPIRLFPGDSVRPGRPFRAQKHGIIGKFSRNKLRRRKDRVPEAASLIIVGIFPLRLQRCTFCTACQNRTAVPAPDFGSSQIDCRQSGSTLQIHGQRRNILRQSGLQSEQTAQISSRSCGISADQQIRRSSMIPFQKCLHHLRAQNFRTHLPEYAVLHTEMGAKSSHDKYSFHFAVSVLTVKQRQSVYPCTVSPCRTAYIVSPLHIG